MKKIGKSVAFIIGLSCIMFIFIVTTVLGVFKLDTSLPIGAVLTAIVSLTTAFIGIEMANNGVRGKYFNQGVSELDAEQRGK